MNMRSLPFLLLLLVAGQARADQQYVDETKSANPDGFIHINIIRGDVIVEGWDQDEIRVKGELDERTREFVFDVRGDDARIEVRIEESGRSWWGSSNGATDLTIHVPEASNVDVSVVSTDVSVSNILGGIEIGGVSGDLHVDDVSDRIDLRSVSGDIELRQAAGRIRIKTVSGDIESYDTEGPGIYHTVSGNVLIDHGGDDLELESVSGDIEVDDTDYVSVRGHSISGSVDISGQLLAGGVVEFDSVSGTVRLRAGVDPDAKFDLETGSGSIRNRLTSDKPRASKYTRNENLRFVMGEGAGEVIITTRSGDIILGR